MAKRAIIMGVPGSGTSTFAQLLTSSGWVAPPPYEGNRPYPTFETKLVRDVNASMMGGSVSRYNRFRDDFEVALPDDPTILAAQQFILHTDCAYDRWFVKQPEITLTYPLLWNKWEWDFVIGVYRDPTACVRSMGAHTKDPAPVRRRGWVRWNSIILENASMTVRFPPSPPELKAFCKALDIKPGADFKIDYAHACRNEGRTIPSWAAETWARLEAMP